MRQIAFDLYIIVGKVLPIALLLSVNCLISLKWLLRNWIFPTFPQAGTRNRKSSKYS